MSRKDGMSKRYTTWILLLLAIGVYRGWAQDTPSGDASGQTGQSQQPVPAYGQESAPAPVSDNPPLSGLDLPSLEPNAAPLSYLQPGATISETADSDVGGNFGGASSFSSITRALGSIALRRLWSHYDLALDYVGGVGLYARHGGPNSCSKWISTRRSRGKGDHYRSATALAICLRGTLADRMDLWDQQMWVR